MRQTLGDHIRTKKAYETAMMQVVLASYFLLPGIVLAMPYQVQGTISQARSSSTQFQTP
jgi:hypothetical protein